MKHKMTKWHVVVKIKLTTWMKITHKLEICRYFFLLDFVRYKYLLHIAIMLIMMYIWSNVL